MSGIDLDRANTHMQRRQRDRARTRQCVADLRQRTGKRRERRDHKRLLALLTETGMLRVWR
jgi:hypothetical protein